VDPTFLADEEVEQEFASSISAADKSLATSLTKLSNISDKRLKLRIAREINAVLELFSDKITDASGQSEGSEFSVEGGEPR
jgi:hypothetical protein